VLFNRLVAELQPLALGGLAAAGLERSTQQAAL
jgi:hypothetical protein